ncbi:MAG: amino-acid N-acetyltransferase [Proteobacteria bacterium]|nr:amino-acid N-acetyltransferase [Pseudomonadota bacterium]
MSRQNADALREAAPYIQNHREKLFVFFLDSRVLDDLGSETVRRQIADIALLHCFGVRIVVVFGIRRQFDRVLSDRAMPSCFGDHGDWRVTNQEQLQVLEGVVIEHQNALAALLRDSLIYHGADEARFDVVTDQRLVLARPYGVREGTDYQFTGVVSKIQTGKIRAQAEFGNLILVSPLVPSAQGQFYNLRAVEVALALASDLSAAKLIVVGSDIPASTSRSFFHAEEFYREMDAGADAAGSESEAELLKHVVRESIQRRVGRLHFVRHDTKDSLLLELFTRAGCGLLISCDPYEQFRPASPDDLSRILELYQHTRSKDEVVRRSADLILSEIGSYYVLLCDHAVIGVAALSAIDDSGAAEIHGVVIDPIYRQQGRGRRLILSLVEKARRDGYRELFALTTQAQSFFEELGMEAVEASALPGARADKIPARRGSKVYRLILGQTRSPERLARP